MLTKQLLAIDVNIWADIWISRNHNQENKDNDTTSENQQASSNEEQSDQRASLTEIIYDTTPPILPVNFAVNDVAYRG